MLRTATFPLENLKHQRKATVIT